MRMDPGDHRGEVVIWSEDGRHHEVEAGCHEAENMLGVEDHWTDCMGVGATFYQLGIARVLAKPAVMVTFLLHLHGMPVLEL